MFIVECQKCGKVEVVSSIADKYGTAHISWTCPNCGAGELLEIDCDATKQKSYDLHKIIKGLGFARGNKFIEKSRHKTPWLG